VWIFRSRGRVIPDTEEGNPFQVISGYFRIFQDISLHITFTKGSETISSLGNHEKVFPNSPRNTPASSLATLSPSNC
jgi:hypothetical protein